MELYQLTASQLVPLLQMLGALVADYVESPKTPMSAPLRKFVGTPLKWKSLPSLKLAVGAALKGGDKLSALYNLSLELRAATPDYTKNQEYTANELDLLRYIRIFLATDNPKALEKIQKSASLFKSPELAKYFMPQVPQSDHRGLRRVVKNLVGRDDIHLTPDESKTLKDMDPEGLSKYAELRKAHNLDFRATLMNYIREKGESKVPYQAAYQFLVSKGFTTSMIPGFTGLLDDQGRWFTRDGKPISGGAPAFTTYSHVVMNPNPSAESAWVFKGVKRDGGIAHFYTQEHTKTKTDTKFDNIKILAPLMNKIRGRWLVKLKEFNPEDKMCVSAAVLEILYFYAARIGTAPGKGVGTLLLDNVRVSPQSTILAYLGKDSIPTRHIIRPTTLPQKQLIAAINILLEGKSKRDFLFTVRRGERWVKCPPAVVNAAFHTFGAPSELTVHKLRTIRGTDLFIKTVEDDAAKHRPPGSDKEAIARWKEYCEIVGKLLNHKRAVGTVNEKTTGATAATSYIDRTAQKDLFAKWGFRLPRMLEKLEKGSD